MYKYFSEEDPEKQSEKPSDYYEVSASTKACKYLKSLNIKKFYFSSLTDEYDSTIIPPNFDLCKKHLVYYIHTNILIN